MNVLDALTRGGYGELHFRVDREARLRAMIAIHSKRLGPALGGCRFLSYETEEKAIEDVLRLAKAMTYKAAISGLEFGGGKAVILRPSEPFDQEALFRAFGRFIHDLGGQYITAEDSGTSIGDMQTIRSVTPFVTSGRKDEGGSGGPSPFTALGVRRAMEACVQCLLGRSMLKGIRVAIQGVGHVGYHLCRELVMQEAAVTVADIDPLKTKRVVNEFGVEVAPIEAIHTVPCDIFAPSALGAALNDETIPQLQCRIVAGAANNQLAEPRHAEALRKRGILYAPDYVTNAGGLICVAQEVHGYDEKKVLDKVLAIYDTIFEIAERAQGTERDTLSIANEMAERVLRS